MKRMWAEDEMDSWARFERSVTIAAFILFIRLLFIRLCRRTDRQFDFIDCEYDSQTGSCRADAADHIFDTRFVFVCH